MTTQTRLKALGGALCIALALPAGTAQAELYSMDRILGDMTFSTFVRLDSSFRTTSQQNTNNVQTNLFQNVTVQRNAYVPPALLGMTPGPGNDWSVPEPIHNDTVRRGDFVPTDETDINYLSLRLESEAQIKLSRDLRIVGRVRALYDPGIYGDFDAGNVSHLQETGIIGGNPELYQGETNYFEYRGREGRKVNPLEFAGEHYMVDFPALLVEYKTGALTIRAGNQQIAWGQAIFFQTLDLPNGLDLRRHLVLDRGFEEFSDKRVPKLSVRGTYQANELVIDSYVGKFQPSVLGNPNTPFNVIPAQFTLYENYYSGDYDNKLDAGIRFKADYGQWGWQAAFVSRYNPLGVISWAASGVVSELDQTPGSLGQLASLAYLAKSPLCDGTVNPTLCRNADTLGTALAQTPFVPEPAGVYSAREWWTYGADARLNGLDGFNAAVDDFPMLRDVFVTNVDSYEELSNQLNTLMIAAGGSYRGYIERDYARENVFGLGGVYVTESENDLLNAIILNLEVQYTPERRFTHPTLRNQPFERDEWIASLVMEKWTRWSATYPAAYLVAQYQFRSQSDLVGRHLDGYGGDEQTIPQGISSANYIVLAALQPFPGRKYVIEFASLIDAKGGVLVQPLLQWNIGNGFSTEVYYNYIHANAWGKQTENIMGSIDWADEAAIRIKYAFN